MRTFVRGCAVVGGLAWVVRWVYLAARDPESAGAGAVADSAYWAGAVLLVVGLFGAAAGLVSASAPWLQGFVGAAVVVLAASVLALAHDSAGDDVAVDGFMGAVAALVWSVVLVVRRPRPSRQPAHAHRR